VQEKLGCLPVKENDGTLVGIVTRGDFLNLALTLLRNGQPRFEAMLRVVW